MNSPSDSSDSFNLFSSSLNSSQNSNPMGDSTGSLGSSTSSYGSYSDYDSDIESDGKTFGEFKDVTDPDPSDETALNVTQSAGPDNFPARWVWGLIKKDRTRVVDLSFRPEEGPTGGVRYEKYSMQNPDLDVITVRLHFRLTYLNDKGVEKYKDKEFVMYTRIPYPDGTDPQKEKEAAVRADLAIRAYTYPVLASMDPKQRVDELWNDVSHIVDATIFHVSRSDYDVQKDRFKKAKVYYGSRALEYNFTLAKVSEKRELIFTGQDYCFGPKVTKRTEGQRPMQVESKFFPSLATPCFNNNLTLHELQSLPPEEISTGRIRAHGMDPKAYLTRLQREHERDQVEYDRAKKLLLEPRGWVPQYLMHSIKPSYEFSKFQSEISPSIWNRFKRAIGLNQGFAYKKQRFERHAQKSADALAQKDAQIANAPAGTAAEQDALRVLQGERKALQNKSYEAQSALAQLHNEFGKDKGRIEGTVGMMEALHLRMSRRLEQMDTLLENTMADGGMGLNDPGSTELDATERTEWLATLTDMNKDLRRNIVYLQRAINSLQGIGLDFNDEKQQVSTNALADDIDSLKARIDTLNTQIGDHLDEASVTHRTYHDDTSNEEAEKEHRDATAVLQSDQDNIRSLIREIDQDIFSANKILARRDLDDGQRDRLEESYQNLEVYRDDLLQADRWVRDGLQRYALAHAPSPDDMV
jgi:predicted  nucleic acid-binding Zn-ribbon protein